MTVSSNTKAFLYGMSFCFTIAIFYVFYNHDFLYYLRMLVVLLHESSHALAALATGGEIQEFNMSPKEGGYVQTLGGTVWIMAMAGYLGSLFWGVLFLFFSSVSRHDRWAFLVLSLWTLGFTLLYYNDAYTLKYGLITAGVLFVFFIVKIHAICDLGLKAIGLFSIVYVPHDIFSDTISRSHLESDAYLMAKHVAFTTATWGWIWLGISILVGILGLVWTIKGIKYTHDKALVETDKNIDMDNKI